MGTIIRFAFAKGLLFNFKSVKMRREFFFFSHFPNEGRTCKIAGSATTIDRDTQLVYHAKTPIPN